MARNIAQIIASWQLAGLPHMSIVECVDKPPINELSVKHRTRLAKSYRPRRWARGHSQTTISLHIHSFRIFHLWYALQSMLHEWVNWRVTQTMTRAVQRRGWKTETRERCLLWKRIRLKDCKSWHIPLCEIEQWSSMLVIKVCSKSCVVA